MIFYLKVTDLPEEKRLINRFVKPYDLSENGGYGLFFRNFLNTLLHTSYLTVQFLRSKIYLATLLTQ